MFLEYDPDYDNMYGPLATSSAAVSTSAIGAASATGPPRDKLESRFAWLLSSEGVADSTMDAFGTLGLLTLSNFRYIAKDEAKLRAFLKKDPFKLDEDDNAKDALEVAKVVAVYESAKETVAVEVKHRAERLHQDLPPKVTPGAVSYTHLTLPTRLSV